MAGVAKGRFPARPRRKIVKRKVKNFRGEVVGQKWGSNLILLEQVRKNLRRFYDIFGYSEEDDEFHGFSSEECGLIAYKRVNGNKQGLLEIPDILCSPIDLKKKKVTTRLAHARNSLDSLPSTGCAEKKKAAITSNDHSSNDLRNSPAASQKTSPIKPAKFIAPSSIAQHNHHVTNVTPTCLKIKMNPDDADEPGHPNILAKALLARANKRVKKAKISLMELPVCTSTPVAQPSKSKARSFVLPTKSTRSSRIIKANRKYVDNVPGNTSQRKVTDEPLQSPIKQTSHSAKIALPQRSDAGSVSPGKGRPLLKEPTFRVAALANINNKPRPTRDLKDISNKNARMRAHKLIKRARFKHPTSSSTLVVGNDFEEEADKKKNLIREATFKAPSRSKRNVASNWKKDDLSDLGLSKEIWNKIIRNEANCPKAPLWTRQEIHNVLHGANTFLNSWSSIARHYDYHPAHRDWASMKAKVLTLENLGLLSENLKVKSSLLLQLNHRYSQNPNVTVFTPKELGTRGMKKNVECKIGEGGRMINVDIHPDVNAKMTSLRRKNTKSYRCIHIERFREWQRSISKDLLSPKSVYLNLDKKTFHTMCLPARGTSKKKATWSAREIHNVLHGIHIFGVGQWSMISSLYMFQLSHSNVDIRGRYKAACCKWLVVGGQVKKDILPLLQPKLSAEGRKYFDIDTAAFRSDRRRSAKIHAKEVDGKTDSRKRRMSETDLTSPPRKQAYHLFGTAPVWDDTSSTSGLQSLKSSSDAEEDLARANVLPSPDKPKRREKDRRASDDKGKKTTEEVPLRAKSKGPRIKHVCRRASLVTGRKVAVYGDGSPDLHLSALPKDEREKIAAEVEKHRGTLSDSTVSTDTEDETTASCLLPKQLTRRKEKIAKVTKKKMADHRCKTNSSICKNCKLEKCGNFEYCRNESRVAGSCLRRQHCVCSVNGSSALSKEAVRKSSGRQKRNKEKKTNVSSRTLPSHSTSPTAGVVLSSDSRRRLQQESNERSLQIPSVVKIDEWKERYELQDLWEMGGVGTITSTTPSTCFVCFLCGSVGKTQPARHISANSELSTDPVSNWPRSPLFIFCCACCEPFHPFCLDYHEQRPAIADAKKGIWVCKRCRFCNVCGRPGDLLECKRCTKTYHGTCLSPSYPARHSKNQVWVCTRCVRCRSCGASRPGRQPGAKWTHDFQLCQRCGDLFDKGNFCPICRRCYRDEDYESRMVQCGACRRWVHSRCESLSIEMYALLSHLPDDVQYVCPDCDGRRAKVETELGHDNATLTHESAIDSLEGDTMRGLLCKLPSPPWKEILESEVQTGIETVTMALYHNKEVACVLKKGSSLQSAAHEEGCRPADMFAVRYAVQNGQYTSVAEFSSDICCVLDESCGEDVDGGIGSKKKSVNSGASDAFRREMHNVFPWFDVDKGRVRDFSDVSEDLFPQAILPPYDDHSYAQWHGGDIDISVATPDTPQQNLCNDAQSKSDGTGTIVWNLSPPKEHDMRQCLFCGKYGDDRPVNAGRLVYCGQDEWVHVNCALWSAEVFERHDGSLQNVYSAVSRGRMMKCEFCKLPGATVGCNTRDCPNNYHFACAKLARCSFQHDKKVFCARHVRHVDGELVPEEGFEICRRVVVDNDEMRPNKRWQRGMQSRNVTILLGSAIIHQLGHLSPTSDDRDYLIPVHFRMTRLFWSTVHPDRRVRYTISVTEQKSALDGQPLLDNFDHGEGRGMEQYENHTIVHESDGDDNAVKRPSNSSTLCPSTDHCKSRLIDRARLATALERSKSHDETGAAIPKSRRLSGSLSTTIGAWSRTLPQAGTSRFAPYQSSTFSPHLMPSVGELTDVDAGMNSTRDSADIVATDESPIVFHKEGRNDADDVAILSDDTISASERGDTSTESALLELSSTISLESQQFSTSAEHITASTPLNTGSSGSLVRRNSLPNNNLSAVEDRNALTSLGAVKSHGSKLLIVLGPTACDKAVQALCSRDDVLLYETPVANVRLKNSDKPKSSQSAKTQAKVSQGVAVFTEDNAPACNVSEKFIPKCGSVCDAIAVKNPESGTSTSEIVVSSQSLESLELRVTLKRLKSPEFAESSAKTGCEVADNMTKSSPTIINPPSLEKDKKGVEWSAESLPVEQASPGRECSDSLKIVPECTSVVECDQILPGNCTLSETSNVFGELLVSSKSKETMEVRRVRTRSRSRHSGGSTTSGGDLKLCTPEKDVANNSDCSVRFEENLPSNGEEKSLAAGLSEKVSEKPTVVENKHCDFSEGTENGRNEIDVDARNFENDLSRSNSFDGSSASESSNGGVARKTHVVRVRRFAKERVISTKVTDKGLIDGDGSCPHRIPHESTPIEDEAVIKATALCSGLAHSRGLDSTEGKPSQGTRSCTKSSGSNMKKKKTLRSSELTNLEGSPQTPRYPRRNPFTCLKSFAGLSPNYAILSYSSTDSKKFKRGDQANSRSLKKEKDKRQAKVTASPKATTSSRKTTGEIMEATVTERAAGKLVKDSAKTNFTVEQPQKKVEMAASDVAPAVRICDVANRAKDASDFVTTTKLVNRRLPKAVTRIQTRSRTLNNDGCCVNLVNDTATPASPMTAGGNLVAKVKPASGGKNETAEECKVFDGGTKSTEQVNGSLITKCAAQGLSLNVQGSDHNDGQNSPHQSMMELRLPKEVSDTNSLSLNTEFLTPSTDILDNSNANNLDASKNLSTDVQGKGVLTKRDDEIINSQEDDSVSRSLSGAEKSVPEPDAFSAEKSTEETWEGEKTDLSIVSLPPIEIERGITPNDKSAENPIRIEPDIAYEAMEKQSRLLPAPTENAPKSPVATFDLPPLKQLQPLAVNDMESPLSPRDEPRLPDQADAAASFLVTSECPVLNVDEVQSLLAMPATSVMPTQTVTLSSLTSPTLGWATNYRIQTHVSPTALQENVIPYQYIQSPTTLFTYNAVGPLGPHVQNQMPVQQLAYAVPVPRTVLSGLPYSPSLAIQKGNGQRPLHVEYHYVQPQYEMVFQTPLMPVIDPTVRQPAYVAGPNRQLLLGNAQIPTAAYLGNVQPAAHMVYSARKVLLSRDGTPKVARVQKRATVAAPVEVTSQNADRLALGLNDNFTHEQVVRLNGMIDFFSDKNDLSPEEKHLVREVVAKKISHKNLTLSTSDILAQLQPVNSSERQDEGAGRKCKRPAAASKQPCAKKQKRRKGRESSEMTFLDSFPDYNFSAVDEDLSNSPLLNVYMNAIHAESARDDELKEKWRDVVTTLSKHNVNLDIPRRLRKGRRDNENRLPPQSSKRSHLLYEIKSEDGYYAKGADLRELVVALLDAVQECRSSASLQTSLLCLSAILSPHAFLGVSHDAIRFLVEQLPGARHCMRYRAKYHKQKESPVEVVTHINPHGCARAEKYQGRSKPDMFGFLASKHRPPPSYEPSRTQNIDMQPNSTRRPTSMDLPMAMRFRHLKTSAREAVDVYRSAIHGRGLYCKRDIEAGEMVMEYTGEAIRSFLTDRREKKYEKKGIGCYMFRMDDTYVVDATMMGSAARFINHSCDPSCYSRMVTIDGKKHIIIFALRKIFRGEELTYDYKFPIEAEDQKIMCNCGARTCRKFMN